MSNSSRIGAGREGGGAAVSILLLDALKPLPRGFAVGCCSVRTLLQDPALSPAEPEPGTAPWGAGGGEGAALGASGGGRNAGVGEALCSALFKPR